MPNLYTELDTLAERRDDICKKFAKDNKLSGPIKELFNNKCNSINHDYNLRGSFELNCMDGIKTNRFLNFITCKY